MVVDRQSLQSLQDQIADHIRRLVTEGVLAAGMRIPTTRELARQLGVSRNTAMLAYERLISEGVLQTRLASGTFVAEHLPAEQAQSQERSVSVHPRRPLAFRGRMPERLSGPFEFDMRIGAGDPSLFPSRDWARHVSSVLDRQGGRMSTLPPPAGDLRLRTVIARWLGQQWGVSAQAEHLLITTGRQQAIAIVAMLLLNPGDGVAMETPGHLGARHAFEAVQATVVPVPVDEHGLRTELLPPSAALAYVTPTHQYPAGGTLPLERRRQLLAWARDCGAFVLEDGVGGEFHFDHGTPPTLKQLDRDESVIHCGSFSRTMGGGFRLGYMVLPPDLMAAAVAAKALTDGGCPWLEQAALANFFETGGFTRHLAGLSKILRDRRDRLRDAVLRRIPGAVVTGTEVGTHLSLHLPDDDADAATISRLALDQGIGLQTFQLYGGEGEGGADAILFRRTLFLGYGALPAGQIEAAVERLTAVIRGISATPA